MGIETQTPPQALTADEQDDRTTQREEYDLLFAQQGYARRDASGRIIPESISIDQEMADDLQAGHAQEVQAAAKEAEEAAITAQVEPFLRDTPEGQQIAEHETEMGKLQTAVACALNLPGYIREPARKPDSSQWTLLDSRAYMEANDINYQGITGRVEKAAASDATEQEKKEGLQLVEGIVWAGQDLQRVTRDLIKFPQYRFGAKVAVIPEKGSKDDDPRVEQGWQIRGINPKGQLDVVSPIGDTTVSVSVRDLNRAAEVASSA